MKSLLVASLLSVAASSVAAAAEPAADYSDSVYGFSLEVPDLGDPAGALVVQRVAFAAPAADGFAANCNVQVQFLEMSFASYMDMSRKQFAAAGLEVVFEKEGSTSGRPAATIEYTGTMGGRDLGFLARVVGGEDRFWLVTCTALQSSFERYRADFQRLLESLEVTQAAPEGSD